MGWKLEDLNYRKALLYRLISIWNVQQDELQIYKQSIETPDVFLYPKSTFLLQREDGLFKQILY